MNSQKDQGKATENSAAEATENLPKSVPSAGVHCCGDMTINIQIDGKLVRALVDTGSHVSIIKQDIIADTQDVRTLRQSKYDNVISVSGEQSQILGVSSKEIAIGAFKGVTHFQVLKDVHFPVILGRDFMHDHVTCIDVVNNELVLLQDGPDPKQLRVRMNRASGTSGSLTVNTCTPFVVKARLAKYTKLKPNGSKWVHVYPSKDILAPRLHLSPMQDVERKYNIELIACDVDGSVETFPCEIRNKTDKPVILPPNLSIAFVSEVPQSAIHCNMVVAGSTDSGITTTNLGRNDVSSNSQPSHQDEEETIPVFRGEVGEESICCNMVASGAETEATLTANETTSELVTPEALVDPPPPEVEKELINHDLSRVEILGQMKRMSDLLKGHGKAFGSRDDCNMVVAGSTIGGTKTTTLEQNEVPLIAQSLRESEEETVQVLEPSTDEVDQTVEKGRPIEGALGYRSGKSGSAEQFSDEGSMLEALGTLSRKLEPDESITCYYEGIKRVSRRFAFHAVMVLCAFLNGLPRDLKKHVLLEHPADIEEAFHLAVRYNDIHNSAEVVPTEGTRSDEIQLLRNKITNLEIEVGVLKINSNSRSAGQRKKGTAECSYRDVDGQMNGFTRTVGNRPCYYRKCDRRQDCRFRCFACHGFGHIRVNCPYLNRRNHFY